MTTIIFEPHATTIDNEAKLASGHNDVGLSGLGLQNAKDMGGRYKDDSIAAIFCSDLQRSYKTAEIAFAGRDVPIIQDKRLRECDYGALTQHPKAEIDQQRATRVTEPFPGGESYEQTTARIRSFLDDLGDKYTGKRIMIIGHRATQYGLEYLLEGVPLAQAVTDPWKWQPGWTYHLKA